MQQPLPPFSVFPKYSDRFSLQGLRENHPCTLIRLHPKKPFPLFSGFYLSRFHSFKKRKSSVHDSAATVATDIKEWTEQGTYKPKSESSFNISLQAIVHSRDVLCVIMADNISSVL